jgi:predicted DsbA family dithiol-disulfide isomerase
MQFFFDYECPYCKKGYERLMEEMEEMEKHPDIEIEYRPIESHPLPEDHPPHTYLAGQCYYIALELGADMPAFHAAMYQAISIERRNVEDPQVLCDILKGIIDEAGLRSLLDSGKYAAQIDGNNDLAYEKSGVWYVPAFRMGDKKLDARGGIGVSADEVRNFLG